MAFSSLTGNIIKTRSQAVRWAGRQKVYMNWMLTIDWNLLPTAEISSLLHHNKILIWHFFCQREKKNRKFKRALMVNPKRPSQRILMQKIFYYIMLMTIKTAVWAQEWVGLEAEFLMYVWHWNSKSKILKHKH